MPNAINPNDYNIDSFNSQNLGPISVSDFRMYVLKHNLLGVNPEIQTMGYSFYPRGIFTADLWLNNPSIQDLPNLSDVSFIPSDTNNQTAPRPDNIKQNLWTNNKPFYGSPTNEEQFEVNTKSLENPGSVDAWVEGNGFETEVSTIRDIVNLSNNEYGPQFVSAYNDPNQPLETTGYDQYPTNSGTADILGQVVGRTLGFSTTNFINFPSDLQDVAQERRGVELQNRIKLNFIDDTVGKINLDPLGLLAGQQLFTPNYTITRPDNFLGKVAEFSANLVGFNVPISIIPGGKNTKLGSNAFQEDLIDYTGKGQRDLLYANVYSSKYSPELLSKGFDPENEDKSKLLGKIGDFFDNLGKQTADNYLVIGKKGEEEKKTLAQKVGGFINGLISPQGDESLIPNPEKSTSPHNPFVNMGTQGQYNAIQSLDENSKFNFIDTDSPLYTIFGASTDYQPNNTTLVPTLGDNDNPNSSFTHQTPSANNLFDWRDRDEQVANRGLLKFTQDMINDAEVNGHRGAAQYIGRFNSDSNIVQGQKDIGGGQTIAVPKHKDVSMGNLVRSGDDTYYCRSWSTRNPYQNHYDLIRRDSLYRGKFVNNMSVLEDNGHVKIAPYSSDKFGQASNAETKVMFNADDQIKRHMFSIENLAWMDAPEKIGLDPCELGPNGGRIMWFPPYDINFTDNTSISWEQNIFIGRAEPIYTYNHTDRKGTLSFSVITDHPSVINEMKQEDERILYKFFAGCGVDVEGFFGREVVVQLKEEAVIEQEILVDTAVIKPEDPIPEPNPMEPPFKEIECYFRNARRSKLVGGVRKGDGRDIEEELSVDYELTDTWKTDKGDVLELNSDFVDKIDGLIDFLATKRGQEWGVEFIGYTSAASTNQYNEVLSIDRAQSVFRYVKSKVKTKGETGGSGYIYNPRNDGNQAVGYVCMDTQENCAKATEVAQNGILDIGDLKIEKIPNDENSYKQRWVINAKAEQGSAQVDSDGNSISEENATFGDSNKDSEAAKRNRKVKIKIFKNEEYILNNEVSKLEPKKAKFIENNIDKELIGLIEQDPIVNFEFNESPVTDKTGTESSINLIEDERLLNEANLYASTVGKSNVDGTTLGELTIDNEVSSEEEIARKAVTLTVEKLFNECSYFEKIKKDDPFVYKTINEKIKHFHPAFHSITPEGFNNRLTFLQQCTRQGPNIREPENQTQNMAFGRPPICVLRIGDFYHTKIVIDSVNITYEPLQWDMNPEGIGVQPQIAKIDLNFSFIGGSSMSGPIRQLQNAVSFNFFANTSVYSPRRYFDVGDDRKYKTLDELLVNSDDGNITVGSDIVGYGSFKSQIDADREITPIRQVKDSNDNQEQTNDVPQKQTNGGTTLPPPDVDLPTDFIDVKPEVFSQEEINMLYPNRVPENISGDGIPNDTV